jgi:hypothetical protein
VAAYSRIVITSLWFLAAYLWVVLLGPLTTAAHRRAAVPTATLLGAAVGAVDVARFCAGLVALGAADTALVWVCVHQLGCGRPRRVPALDGRHGGR